MASNLTQLTREFIDKGFKSSIRRVKSPILTKLIDRKQIIPGGLRYEQINETADKSSQFTWYGPNTQLGGGTKELYEKPHWHVAYGMIPDEEDVDERVMNRPKGDHQLQMIAKQNASNIIYSIGKVLAQAVYSSMTDTEEDASHTRMQGLPSALIENLTYGGLTRSGSTTNEWWQAADYANWDTAYTINKYNLDNWFDAVMEYAEDASDIMVVMGTTLYNALKQQFESSNEYNPTGSLAKQGFTSMTYNDIEIVKDFWLESMVNTTLKHKAGTNAGLDGSGTYTGAQAVAVLDMSQWHLRYWPPTDASHAETMSDDWAGYIEVTEWFEQSKILGGQEKWLRRFKFKGNLTCDNPRRNLWRSNVT
jgi:hypothetical protein